LGKIDQVEEKTVSSWGAQAESSRSRGVKQNCPASRSVKVGRRATLRFGQGITHSDASALTDISKNRAARPKVALKGIAHRLFDR